MELVLAKDIQTQISQIVKTLNLVHIDKKRLVCFRSFGSSSRARARIWGFPKIWQMALKLPAHYCLEVLAEKFDHLNSADQTRVLIHELLHIPKNFSGSLLPHGTKRAYLVNNQRVESLFYDYRRFRQ